MSQLPGQWTDTYTPDNLIAGTTQLVSRSALLAAGQGVLKRGTMMGKLTASNKLVVSIKAASDGSQVPYGVLYDDYDTTGGDVLGGCYVAGEMNANAMTFGAGWTGDNAFDALRDVGIYLKSVVSASGQYIG